MAWLLEVHCVPRAQPEIREHVHPWNGVETEMVYRQRNTFDQPSSEAVQDVLGVFATRADLAQEGKVDSLGRPKNPLQLAVTLRTLNKYGGYDARMPIFVQNLVGGTLGRLAELMGYKAVDSKYFRVAKSNEQYENAVQHSEQVIHFDKS